MQKKVGIDSLHLSNQYTSGVERYIFLLIEALSNYNYDLDFYVFVKSGCPQRIRCFFEEEVPDNMKLIEIPSRVLFPLAIKKHAIDVLHSTFYPPPIFCKTKVVYTLHDAGRYLYPHLMSKNVRIFHNNLIKMQIKRRFIKRIITPSKSSKRDILTYFSGYKYFPPIDVVPNYLSKALLKNVNKELEDEVRRKYNIRKNFILAVGHFYPLKNTSRLVSAFNKICHKGLVKDFQLVIVGRFGWDKTHKMLGYEKNVLFLGNISDDDLCVLYKMCKLFVFLSLYEGFGLPLLEAMYYNASILCSDIPLFLEICEDAVIYCDPYNTDSIAGGIIASICGDYGSDKTKYSKILSKYSPARFERGIIKSYKEAIDDG